MVEERENNINHSGVSGHSHSHLHSHHQGACKSSAIKNIKWAFLLNFAFTIIEFFGALYVGSVAVMADAVHDLGDTFSLALAYLMEKWGKKAPDKNFTYGYRRLSLLAAFINSLVLIVGSLFMVFQALPRLVSPPEVHAPGMAILAVVGVLFNLLAFFQIRKGNSLSEEVLSWHMIEDILGWVLILVGSGVIYFFGTNIIDPILSIIIAFFILFNVGRSLKKTIITLLQSAPQDIDLDDFEKKIQEIPEVLGVHDTHIWSLDGEFHVATTHCVVGESMGIEEMTNLKKRIKAHAESLGINHSTIEIEREGHCATVAHPSESSLKINS